MAASIEQSKADSEKAQLEFQRGDELYKQHLIARQDFDQRKSTFDGTKAAVQVAQARLAQAKAQMAQSAATTASSQKRVAQIRANLARYTDVLRKFDSFSPLDGVVTNLPVRVGESVVPGVQNSAGSTIMTIADMSIITSEVKVDETDIVNVQLNQSADVTIDAIPNKIFKGHVIEIGNTAIVRSTGLAASQSNTSNQEAKDFKVVVAIDSPPADLRPGLSSTSKITTAVRTQALTIPIQALTVRQKGDLDPKHKEGSAPLKLDPATEKANKEEIQGVFVVANAKAIFRKVEVGITGSTDIEVTGGLKDGEEIVTGPYQVIRTLRTDASVKVDNKPPVVKPAS